MCAMKEMAELATDASVTRPERRAYRRFPLHCPARATLGVNGVRRRIEGSTENVSTAAIR
jgi:hypothetical protein